MRIAHQSIKYLVLFLIGGMAYALIEIAYRGNTHGSMVIAGGLVFVLIGLLNEGKRNPSFLGQMVISCLIITGIELVTGMIVNRWLGWNVWNYSKLPYNFMGQICLAYSVLWFFLSAAAIVLDDVIKFCFFGEKKPRYHLF